MSVNLYLILKTVHVGAVTLSATGFVARGMLMLASSPVLGRKWIRVAPHIVDTVLLGAAIWMTVLLGQYPFTASWLTAKLLALVAYVVLGSIALRRGRTRGIRIAAWFAALAALVYIIGVALAKDPAWGLLRPTAG